MKLSMLLVSVATVVLPAAAQIPKGFKPIFNGKDLNGWHTSRTSHQGTTGNFYVEDGAITLKQNPYGQGGVLLSDVTYKDFELYIEVKVDSFCNGGIFLRSTESGQAYQVELANPGGTGTLLGEAMTISQPAKAENVAKVWKPGDWNAFRIRMVGTSLAAPPVTTAARGSAPARRAGSSGRSPARPPASARRTTRRP